MATRSKKTAARQTAEARKARSETGGKDAKGQDRNVAEQEVHDEGEVEHLAHEENTDRELDALYSTDDESEVIEWKRHSDLDAPPSRDGYVNRFIRIRLGTVRDTARLRNAMREGWRPVKKSSVTDRSLPSVHLEKVGDVIGVEDLILCEMPKRAYQKRKEYFKAKLARMNAAIERQLRNVSQTDVPGFGPIQQQRATSVTRAPAHQNVGVADDEI